MEHKNYLEDGLRLLKEHPVVFILCGVLAMLVSGASFGILSGPLFGAYFLMAIQLLRDNQKPKFADIFAGFPRFLELVPFVLVSVLIVIGFFLYILPGIMLLLCWIYTLPLMADKRMSLFEAMKISFRKVKEKGFYMHFSFLFILVVIPEFVVYMFGAFMPVAKILRVVLIPFQCGCLASLYIEQFCDISLPSQITGSKTKSEKQQEPPLDPTSAESDDPEAVKENSQGDEVGEKDAKGVVNPPPLPDSKD